MNDFKCSFTATLITEEYSCEQAQIVTRRGGPDIACASESGSNNCAQVYIQFKDAGLPAFDAQDDLLKTPASVYNKIQFGGLQGLSKLINEDNNSNVNNIFQLIQAAEKNYTTLENIPYTDFIDSMKAYKIKRKRKLK